MWGLNLLLSGLVLMTAFQYLESIELILNDILQRGASRPLRVGAIRIPNPRFSPLTEQMTFGVRVFP